MATTVCDPASPQDYAGFANLAVITLIVQGAHDALVEDLSQHVIKRTGDDCRTQNQLSREATQWYYNRMGAIVNHQLRSVAASVF